MIGLLIALGVLLLIGFTRIRLLLRRDEAGLVAFVRVGVVRVRLYPRPPDKPGRAKTAPEKPRAKRGLKEEKPRLGIRIDREAISDLLGLIRKTLRRTARLARFERIELRFVSGGEDAAQVAIHCGRLNQIVYALYPLVKNNLRVKKTKISVLADYSLPKSVYYGQLNLSVSIGRALVFALSSGGSALGFYLRHRQTKESEDVANGQQRQAQAG